MAGGVKNALSYALDRGATEIAELLRSAGCTLPVEQVPAVKWVAPDPKHEPIRKHLKEILGPIEPLCLREAEPAETHIQTTCPPLEVAIHVARPTADQPYLTLFTSGVSDHPLHIPETHEEYRFAELVLRLPPTFELSTDHTELARFWPLYWLRRLAYYPHHARTYYDGPWFTLEPSEPPVPIAPGVPQTGFLFVADYPPCTPLTCEDGKLVRFYTVMTAYPEECRVAFRRGTFRLVERFARKSLRLIADPARPNTF